MITRKPYNYVNNTEPDETCYKETELSECGTKYRTRYIWVVKATGAIRDADAWSSWWTL